MAFSDHKIAAFTHKITDLPDQPNLPADELKARFDSSPEELRQAHNALCDDADRLDDRVSGIIAETFGDTISKSMLSDELQDELDAKAVETSVASRFTAEQTAREAADSALSTRVSTAESKLNTQSSQIAQKCQAYIGTYTGDGAESKTISLGFRPKAVLVYCEGYIGYNDGRIQGGLILDGTPMTFSSAYQPAAEIISSGFIVRSSDQRHQMNINQVSYSYLAFRA